MKLGGISKNVKYYNLELNEGEMKILDEMIVNEIEYINEEMMGYESAVNRGLQLEQKHHREIHRLKGNFLLLGLMERQIKGIMTKLNKDQMQEDMR